MHILPLATASAKDFEHTSLQGHSKTPVLGLRLSMSASVPRKERNVNEKTIHMGEIPARPFRQPITIAN